jgi:hypothetical protein
MKTDHVVFYAVAIILILITLATLFVSIKTLRTMRVKPDMKKRLYAHTFFTQATLTLFCIFAAVSLTLSVVALSSPANDGISWVIGALSFLLMIAIGWQVYQATSLDKKMQEQMRVIKTEMGTAIVRYLEYVLDTFEKSDIESDTGDTRIEFAIRLVESLVLYDADKNTVLNAFDTVKMSYDKWDILASDSVARDFKKAVGELASKYDELDSIEIFYNSLPNISKKKK